MLRVLLYEYKKSLRITRKILKEADNVHTLDNQLKTDKSIINGMISDLEYVIDWIEHGREPGNKRGADRTKVYLMDPLVLNQVDLTTSYEEGKITDQDLKRINEALISLSDKERDMYILHKANLFSFEEIANLLGVSKGTVQTTIKRAECKIRKEIKS